MNIAQQWSHSNFINPSFRRKVLLKSKDMMTMMKMMMKEDHASNGFNAEERKCFHHSNKYFSRAFEYDSLNVDAHRF